MRETQSRLTSGGSTRRHSGDRQTGLVPRPNCRLITSRLHPWATPHRGPQCPAATPDDGGDRFCGGA